MIISLQAIEGTYIDKKCPFTGNVSIRGRILTGIVASMKMKRTIVIRRDYLHHIKKYNRFEKRHKNLSAHLSPCFRFVKCLVCIIYSAIHDNHLYICVDCCAYKYYYQGYKRLGLSLKLIWLLVKYNYIVCNKTNIIWCSLTVDPLIKFESFQCFFLPIIIFKL